MRQNNLKDYISRIKYKPNWKFFVKKMDLVPFYKLTATMVVKDVLNPDCTIPISSYVCIKSEIAESGNEQFYELKLQEVIKSMEIHEMNEWLTLDGTHLVEPHPQ